MTFLNKLLIGITLLTIISAGLFILYKEHQIQAQQEEIQKSVVEMKQLAGDIARSQSQYVSHSDFDAFAKQNQVDLGAIRSDLGTLGANLTGMNQITVISNGQTKTGVPSDGTKPGDNPNPPSPTNPDPFGYLHNTQLLSLNEEFSDAKVPFGQVSFSAWKDKPWDYTVYPRSYNITNVLGTDQNNRHYVYNKVSITSNGKNYPVKITNAKFEEEYPSPTFSWWNPRLFLAADGAANISESPVKGAVSPRIALGVMSYGSSKITPDLSVLQVGAGYDLVGQRVNFSIAPISYNIGKAIPGHLVDNTYVGPVVWVNTAGQWGMGGGISVGF